MKSHQNLSHCTLDFNDKVQYLTEKSNVMRISRTKNICFRWMFIPALLIFSLSSCKKKDYSAKKMPTSIGAYVYAYTSGIVSRGDDIKVRFNAPVASEDNVGGVVQKGIFSLSPKIDGEAVWVDDRTISFKPSNYFKTSQQYKGQVNIKGLFENVPTDAETFEFNFRTREQFFTVEIDGVNAANADDWSRQEVVGSIYFTDVEELEKVKNIVRASQKGKKLPISYEAGNSPSEYRFKIADVKRGNKGSAVDISWNGKSISVSEKGKKQIEVPAMGDFKVVNARLVKRGDQHIVLTFSDPISTEQNMEGLFGIASYSDKLRYSVDGNQVKVYPSGKLVGTKNLTAFAGIQNAIGEKMKDPSVWTFEFDEIEPNVRLVGKGVIMPESDGLIFPFEAVNLNAVEIEVFKIFENNLLQFLQTNDIDGDYQLNRVGRIIHREKVVLNQLNPNADKNEWTRYAVDLQSLIRNEPGAIYQIRIGFMPSYTDYFCGDENKGDNDGLTLAEDKEEMDLDENSIMEYYYGPNGYYNDYSWRDRDNPCKTAYYNSDKFVKRNVFASNLGLVAKKGNNGSMFVSVSDLRTTDKVSGATIKAFDYQQQLLLTTKTDTDGQANFETERDPYFIVVENGEERGYLKVRDGHSLSLSRFDVSGAVTQEGIKGYIYGERGVWRPGDTLFLNFVLEDKESRLPSGHPVSMEIYNSRGQLQGKTVKTENIGGIYNFTTITSSDDPTGNWSAKVKVGGATFTKTLKIETVKPNRLKINVDFGSEELLAADTEAKADIEAKWLHGAPAGNLKAKVEMQFRQQSTTFPKFNDYVFDDPARKFSSEPVVVYDQALDGEGKGNFTVKLDAKGSAPGKLRAGVKTRVFEKSGDFSSDNYSISYSPYETYAGVSIPKNKYGEKRLDVGKNYNIDVAAVTADGKGAKARNLKVGVYRVNWSWWWDADEQDFTSYNTSTHYGAVTKVEATTNSKGQAGAKFKVERWGRYLVRVCDQESGHCTGDVFYAGYPWDEDGEGENKSAAMLQFTSDKQEYKVGDVVKLSIPSTEVSKGLLTIENGSRVLESKWFNLKEGDNTVKITSNATWTPNVYAHVTLTQPHAQTNNDLPIRMYGVVPIKVVDPKTQLKPEIRMADELQPEKEFTVEVKETSGKPMAYTIAVVDEGLLDLTRFNTPDPWNTFYAREALGVKTWDMYDYVLGAYGGDLERILSVGGGADGKKKKGADQAQRFKPVVHHLGPFYLKRGRKATHKIQMPNYVGSVRTMVVAANEGAYGNAEVTTPVRKPLMVLATLPRVLGPGEELKLPVNVFAMDKKVKDVSVTLETSDLIEIADSNPKSIRFSKIGDQIVDFNIKVKENVGIAKIKVIAKGGGETATQEIEIQVRNPNPYVTDVYSEILEAGESWNKTFSPLGMNGTNEGVLEVSNIPPIDLGKRLQYLIRYPHGCIEQTTSSGFPQLYVSKLMELNENQKKKIPENIQATLERLKLFQVSSGGFSYWPGDSEASEWGSNYAGHFMIEAKKLGYSVPGNMMEKWIKHQQKDARSWSFKSGGFRDHGHYNNNDLMQAYRLFTLALAGKPEKGAMNRLRNTKNLSDQSKWRLAAAYGLTGNTDVANKIVAGLDTEIEDYQELGYTYGSGLRDQAMILETMVSIGDKKGAADLVKDISESLSQDRWHSTQTTAYALLGVGKFVGGSGVGDKFTFTYAVNGNKVNAGSSLPVANMDLSVEGGEKQLSMKNTSKGMLYARLILTGRPITGDQTAAENNLKVSVAYKDADGKSIDPAQLKQGTDFVAEVSITNPSKTGRRYDEMALTQIFPSGWEITNSRMDAIGSSKGDKPEYQDIRDDRIYSYFDINSGKTHKYIIQLNAAYQGRFYLPSISCEAMYDNTISARQPGQWVEVVQPKEI